MGNQHVVHGKAKIAAKKFDSDEIFVLEKIFTEMSERNNGKGKRIKVHLSCVWKKCFTVVSKWN